MESVIFRLFNNITSILKQPLNDEDLEAMSDMTVLSDETINILDRSLPDFVNYLSSLSRENKPLSRLDMEFIKVAWESVAVVLYIANALMDELMDGQKRVELKDDQPPRGFVVGFHCVEWLKAVAMFFPDVIKCDLNKILSYQLSEETPNNFNRDLPSEIDTEQARKYFARAIEAKYMTPTANGYKWEFGGKRGGLARLGYFLYKTLCPTNTEQIPQQAVNRLFGVKRIDSAIAQVHNAKKPQKWRSEIDKLFVD